MNAEHKQRLGVRDFKTVRRVMRLLKMIDEDADTLRRIWMTPIRPGTFGTGRMVGAGI